MKILSLQLNIFMMNIWWLYPCSWSWCLIYVCPQLSITTTWYCASIPSFNAMLGALIIDVFMLINFFFENSFTLIVTIITHINSIQLTVIIFYRWMWNCTHTGLHPLWKKGIDLFVCTKINFFLTIFLSLFDFFSWWI